MLNAGSPRPNPRRTSPLGPRARRLGALFAAVAVGASLVVGLAGPASADPTPPPNPSDAQIGAAATTKAQFATEVGQLTAQLSQLRVQVEQLNAAAELAEQKYAYAMQQLAEAKTAAVTAKRAVATAQAEVDRAHAAFNASVRANYTQGGVDGGSAALLTAGDPSQMLQSAAFQAYVTGHQADGIGQLDRAKVAKANADGTARAAVATQTQRTTAAEQAYTDARSAQQAAQQEQASVATQTTAVQTKLDTAQAALLGLQGQRAKYDAWKAEQARIAEARRQAQIAAQIAATKKAQEEAARQAAEQAAQNQNNNNGGGSSGGGSSGGGSSGGGSSSGGGGGGGSTGNPTGGPWTPAVGQAAAQRALNWVGTPYAFAGGNADGPTYGVCQSGAAWNDCNVYGFDCSGLALYAWAPWQYMPHYTVAMWEQMAGNYHPSTNDLMPGDLLLYGQPSVQDIHHVAIYVGNGNVVQAPQSGDHVRVTSIWNMGSDYYGAIRPLT